MSFMLCHDAMCLKFEVRCSLLDQLENVVVVTDETELLPNEREDILVAVKLLSMESDVLQVLAQIFSISMKVRDAKLSSIGTKLLILKILEITDNL